MDSNSPINLTSKVFPRYGLWATAANFAKRYGPLRRIWLYAMRHFGKFSYAIWATTGNEAIQ
jgi:hypothetical protein